MVRRAANAWDRFYRHQPSPWRGEHAIAEVLPHLQGRVLELGCGNGKMLRPLQKAGVEAVGLDISWNVLQGLRGAAEGGDRAGNRARSDLVLADASRLPFAAASFGAVLDIHCTGHLLAAGRLAAARDVARVLRAGGVVLTERLAPDDLRTTTGSWTTEPGTRAVEDGRTTHFSTAEELAAEYTAAGLRVEASETLRRSIRHRGQPVVRSAVRVRLRKPGSP